MTQKPGDLVRQRRADGGVRPLGCDLNTAVTNQNTVVAVVFSTGKNGPLPHGANEAQNLDANRVREPCAGSA